MQNKRIVRARKNSEMGLLQNHIINNLRNYIIILIIFLVRNYTRNSFYK